MDSENNKIRNLCSAIKNKYSNISELISQLQSTTLSFLQYYSILSFKNDIGKSKLAKIILQYIHKIYYKPFKGTITLTFGEVAESHVGMQKIGEMAENGFQLPDLLQAKQFFEQKGTQTVLVHLNNFLPNIGEDETENIQLEKAKTDPEYQAYILIVRNGLNYLDSNIDNIDLTTEMLFFDWDSQLYNVKRKVVQQKRARHNLNFSDYDQTADFSQGMGTTISWERVPILKTVREKLPEAFGENAKNLKCEGNLYYEPKNTGIGYHGDSERKKVIGIRLGKEMNIHWNWFYNSRPRGLNVSFILYPGDIYCMSEKTVGTDWMPRIEKGWSKKMYTLRHAAGAPKYTTRTGKINVQNIRKYDNDTFIGDTTYSK